MGRVNRRTNRGFAGRWRLLPFVCALGALGVLAARDAFEARGQALAGMDDLARVGANDAGQPDGARRALADAQDHFDRAADAAHRPTLQILRAVPGVSRQVSSIQTLTRSAAASTAAASGLLDALDTAGETASGDPRHRSLAVQQLATALDATAVLLPRMSAGPSGLLLPPLQRARARFALERDAAAETLAASASLLHGLGGLLDGDASYLLLATNNAEMKLGMGSTLFVGQLDLAGGRATVTDFFKPNELNAEPVTVADPDLARNWGWLALENDIRLTGLSPRFDASAPLASAIASERTGRHYDGVLAFDVETVRLLLATTGPLTIAGRTFDSNNVVRFLTYDQYFVAGRTEIEAALAATAFARLSDGNGHFDMAALRGFWRAVQGRHVLFWSADPALQRRWEGAGAAGQLSEQSLSLGLINRGPDKLDPLLAVTAEIRLAGRYRDRLDVEIDLRVTNTATGSEPAEITSASQKWLARSASEYRAYLAVSAPGEAQLLRIDDFGEYLALGADGPTQIAVVKDFIQPQETKLYRIAFSLPPTAHTLRLEPSARLPGIVWRIGSSIIDDSRPYTLDLLRY